MKINVEVEFHISAEDWAAEYGVAIPDVPTDVHNYFEGQTVEFGPWPAHVVGIGITGDEDARPETRCGCGYPLVWVEGRWEHDAAPHLWGNDHSAEAPEPTGPAREYWDAVDGITN